DLQWLDSASARTLRYALRRLDAEPVGLIATLRTTPAADDPLKTAASLPPGRSEQLDVGPLGLADLRVVPSSRVDSISRPVLARIHEASGGNPLYAIELARGLPSEARGPGMRRGVTLPGSLQVAIEQRLDTVPEALVPLLETVAALGSATLSDLED